MSEENICIRMPTNEQIELANLIAEGLEIDFPISSEDFTEDTYIKFIKEHLSEAVNKNICSFRVAKGEC